MVAAPSRALIAALALLLAAPVAAQLPPRVFTDAAGNPLPFASDAELQDFLRNAEVVRKQRFDEGGAGGAPGSIDRGEGSYEVVLRLGDVETNAIFRSMNRKNAVARFRDGSTLVNFRDHGLFECAAYEVARLVGVDFIPPVVSRRIDNVEGCLQLVVEGTISESERDRSGRADPIDQRWHRQLATMNVFDALIGNVDRNRRNLLYDPSWRVWLTDHSRTFAVSARVDTDDLQAVEQALWVNLGRLTPAAFEEVLGPYLSERELAALLRRREAIVSHFSDLIARRGEAGVVYTY